MRRFVLLFLFLATALAAPKNLYGSEKGIPILMFHRFSSLGSGDYNIAVSDFRKILAVLSKPEYCLIDLAEYAQADFMEGCQGKKPFAISMDDGHPSQFRFLKNGSLDPESGLGALFAVFPKARATMFLNVSNGGAPFGTASKQKITWLRQHNIVIGNHSFSHSNMAKLSSAGVVRELDAVCAYFGQGSMLLAYPYGLMPPKPVNTYKTKCQIQAAFRAWLGYFEGLGQTKQSGTLLAPLPNSPTYSSRRFSYPRLNISSYQDFSRDILENSAWVRLP